MQKCNKCGVEKPLIDYYFRKDTNKYLTICKSCCKNKQKKYYKEHIEKIHNYYIEHKDYFKKYSEENSYKYKETFKKYYQNNKIKYQNKQREYYRNNSDKVKEYNKQYKQEKKKNNELYRKQCYISKRIRDVFNHKGNCNYKTIESIVGISCKDLYNYLLKTFKNNYGCNYNCEEVHIDHIKPLANVETMDDLMTLNHYTNLQLLTPEDNMKKWKHI